MKAEVRFDCPHCSASIRAVVAQGDTVRCPGCGGLSRAAKLVEPAKPAQDTSTHWGNKPAVAWAFIAVLVVVWLSLKTLDRPKDLSERARLRSSSGRINEGTALYSNGEPIGSVVTVSNRDPFSGEKRDMVLIRMKDGGTEWKTRDTVKAFYQVFE